MRGYARRKRNNCVSQRAKLPEAALMRNKALKRRNQSEKQWDVAKKNIKTQTIQTMEFAKVEGKTHQQ